MLLAFLLAAVDDHSALRARRAALHELTQRLLPAGPPQAPQRSLTEILLATYLQLPWDTAPIATLKSIVRKIESLVDSAGMGVQVVADSIRLSTYPVTHLPGFPLSNETVQRSFMVEMPEREHDALIRAWEYATPFVGRMRTERDGLIALVLRTYANQDAVRGPNAVRFHAGVADHMLDHLPSVRDWVAATSPDLSRMTWVDAMRASQAWHGQFKTTGWRDPLPNALVVLRFPDGWTLQRLTEKKDLALEGMSMAHCIGGPDRGGYRDGESSYWQALREDTGVFLSLRNSNGIPEATVEMDTGGNVLQVQGPGDKDLSLDGHAHLREAFWAFPVFPGQRSVPRMGHGGVWDDRQLRGIPDVGSAIAEARSFTATCKGESNGILVKEDADSDRHIVTFRLLGHLLGAATFVKRTKQFMVQPEFRMPKPDGVPFDAVFLGGIGEARNGHPARPLGLWRVRDTLWFTVCRGNDGGAVEYVGTDLIRAFRTYTGAPSEPPSLEGLEAFPGLPKDPMRSNWKRLLVPVAEARKLRAAQGSVG